MLNLFKLPFRFNSRKEENATPKTDLSLGIFRNILQSKGASERDLNRDIETIHKEIVKMELEEGNDSNFYESMSKLLRQIDNNL